MTHLLPLLKGVMVTVQISLASMGAGLIGGVVLGVMNSAKSPVGWLKPALHAFVWIVRGTPLFIQLLIIYYGLPEMTGFSLSPFMAGVIALGINSTAYISEIMRGGINAIPEGQWEASFALGLNRWATFKGIIMPQVIRNSLPAVTNELTCLIKETGILMVIGVAELTKASRDIVARELDPITIYLMAAALYLALTSGTSFIAHHIQGRIPK